MHFHKLIHRALLPVVGLAMLFGGVALGAELSARRSELDGVSIVVKPLDVAPASATWSFEVSMSTHSQRLDDDLVRTAQIVDPARKGSLPVLAWQGDPAGGHHRKGILRFKVSQPVPKVIDLRIQRVGEKAPRVFVWDPGCPCNDPTMHKS